tara:strand:- start:18 stop:977 length:960 start_codon:yes stop_codon:yes gene_type:complete
MATFYKGVEYASKPREQVVYHKAQSFSHNDDGINSIQYRSESLDLEQLPGNHTFTTSGSHYQFVNQFLNNDGAFDGYTNMHRTKLYSSGSVIYIPQQYFGEQIKKKSFLLTDNSTSKTILIKDDGRGNLFSTNAHNSRSVSPASSSDNYVGNINYEAGVVILAETASWSGSGLNSTDINYTDVATGTYNLKFNSTQTIYQNEITLRIKSHEFTATGNQSIFKISEPGSGETHGKQTSALLTTISSSLDTWSPYATGIALYKERPSILANRIIDNQGTDEPDDDYIFYDPSVVPLMVANFPRPVKIDKNSDLTIIIRYDT